MNNLRRTCAAVALGLTLTVPAFAGIIHSPGAADPPPPPSDETSTSTSGVSTSATTDITTDVILTIVSVTPIP